MKNIFIVLLIVTAAALGGFAAYQHNQLAKTRAQLAALERKIMATEAQLAECSAMAEKVALAERKAKVLQDTITQASELSANQSKQVSELEQSLASTKTNSSPLAGLFKNPEMKEMIKAQQKAFMGPMIDKNYAALFKQLNLTPEQSAYVKELLEKKMLVAADVGMSMLDDSVDAEKRKELGKQVKVETDAVDEELKKFLGDDYAAYKDYEKSMPDRMSTSQLKDQLAGSENALDPGQETQLMNALQEARNNFKWTTDFNNPDADKTDFTQMFNEDRVNQHFKEQEDYDQQLLQKAAAFLRPDQLKAYSKFLENQRTMQAAAMKMAAAMFQKPKK